MAAGALAGALLLRVDVALPVLAAALLVALAAVALGPSSLHQTPGTWAQQSG